MTKIFIADATGSIGTALLPELTGQGHDVVAGVTSPEAQTELTARGVTAILSDPNDVAGLTQAMEGCDKLFLSLPLVEGMTRRGHLAVEAAKQAGVQYIVRSSCYAASSDAHWRLGREYGMVDQFVEDSGIDFTVLRPNTFMQIFTTDMNEMIQSGTLALPEEDAKVSYIDAHDIAACAAHLFQNNEGHINSYYALTGPEGLGGADIATAIAAATGKALTYTPIPEEEFIATLADSGVPQWTIDMRVSLSRVVKLGMAGNVTQAVQHLTGKPARSFTDFATAHCQTWK